MSSVIADHKYDAKNKVLTIYFTNGKSYDYTNVPKDIVDGLRKAPSQGAYFNAVIRPLGD